MVMAVPSSSSSSAAAVAVVPPPLSDDPLPLSELRGRMSPRTYAWLEAAAAQQQQQQHDDEEEEGCRISFGEAKDDDGEDDCLRVQEWKSSRVNPDGFGGIEFDAVSQRQDAAEPESIRVEYILSDAGNGHGDVVWAAARHIANLLADPAQCERLLTTHDRDDDADNNNSNGNPQPPNPPPPHPLFGKRFVELGAGAGIPSWTALWCGARTVVCTDQAIPDRIQCLAECAERNLRNLTAEATARQPPQPIPTARACPHNWGSPIEPILEESVVEVKEEGATESQQEQNQQQLFDVVVAADCCYMPEYHASLLASINRLLHPRGVALLPFALHSNTDDKRVWQILDSARNLGFRVALLEARQLTPQASRMDSKRALVHTIKLTRQRGREVQGEVQ